MCAFSGEDAAFQNGLQTEKEKKKRNSRLKYITIKAECIKNDSGEQGCAGHEAAKCSPGAMTCPACSPAGTAMGAQHMGHFV